MVQAIQEKSFVPESSILVLSNQLKLYPSIPFKSEINNNVYFSFEKINPVKYSIHVNASEPFYLVFSESYDNGWVATINGQQVPDQYHFTANGYANGWYINKTGTYTVTLEFTPQNLFYAGAAVSITSLIICTVYFSKNKIKNIYQKHVKKNKVSN
jgi:uncharacterized membrane protein YfhO